MYISIEQIAESARLTVIMRVFHQTYRYIKMKIWKVTTNDVISIATTFFSSLITFPMILP